MKLHIMSSHKRGHIETMILTNINKHLPTSNLANADAVVLFVSYYNNYEFNPELHRINKPIILVDFMEYCWDWKADETHFFGVNTEKFKWRLGGHHWDTLDNFIKDHPPRLYFKRELLAKDLKSNVKPMEYPCYLPVPHIQSKSEFDKRQLEVNFCWGLSHPLRAKLHGEIFTKMNGYCVVSDWGHLPKHLAETNERTWVTVFTPHHARIEYEHILKWQTRSKITVSLPGCGMKCFRHNEANVGSIMALTNDPLAWSFPHEHGVNCIHLGRERLHEDLCDAVKRDDLYDIYVRAQETVEKYRCERYVREYILPNIQAVL